MTEIERQELMPESVRRLAEDIYARAVRYQTGHASREYLAGAASDAISAAKAFEREWNRQKDENDHLPFEEKVAESEREWIGEWVVSSHREGRIR